LIDLKYNIIEKIKNQQFEETSYKELGIAVGFFLIGGVTFGAYKYYSEINRKQELISIATLKYLQLKESVAENSTKKNEEKKENETTQNNKTLTLENKAVNFTKKENKKLLKTVEKENKTYTIKKIYRVELPITLDREKALETVKRIKKQHPELDPFIEASPSGYRVVLGTYKKNYYIEIAKKAAKTIGYEPRVIPLSSKDRVN
jgi:5'-3' exonuclease